MGGCGLGRVWLREVTGMTNSHPNNLSLDDLLVFFLN